AFPAYSHDHPGGPVCGLAADAGHRCRFGTAPAAGPGDGGRPAVQPVAHPVHHAGHLPVVRPPVASPPAPAGGGMRWLGVFVLRPVATSLTCLALVLSGLVALFLLPVAPLPQIDFPMISVTARLAGASPETMASSVAMPLEQSLGSIAGVSEMSSRSTEGSTRIFMMFEMDKDINSAARDVQAAINAARSLLPSSLRSNPTYNKVNPSSAPVMVLALTSKTATQGQLYDLASTVLAQKLSQVSGVGEVEVGGSSLPAIRVSLNPQALYSAGIALDEVRAALSNANTMRPNGVVENDRHHWQISSGGQLTKAEQYKPLIVAWRDGSPVRLQDIAQVEDSV